jgi:hypothetical protein
MMGSIGTPASRLLVLVMTLLGVAAACGSDPDSTFGPTGAEDAGPPPGSLGNGASDGGLGNGCRPRTCIELQVECGSAGDGCGGVVECGACGPGLRCGGPNALSRCVSPNIATGCVPKKTCAEAGA